MSTSCFRLEHEIPDDSSSLGAMGYLFRKLDKLLQTEDGKNSSIIQKFRDDVVRSIYARLEKLSEVHDPPLTVNYWMKDVREISYDMADFFDGLVHAHDTKAEISEFEDLMLDAVKRHDCYDLGNYQSHDSDTAVRLHLGSVYPGSDLCPGLLYTETEPVGIKGRIKELRLLVEPKSHDNEKQLKVISILGCDQGVGMTTLAKKLWREMESESETCRAFVLMAKKPDIRMILGSILSQVRPHEQPGDYRVPNLIHDIRTHLQNKRYFIVIDDLWAVSVWDVVRRAFPDGMDCSRIIITTTVEDVARVCSSDDTYNIGLLNKEQSNELFFSRVFGLGKECPQQEQWDVYSEEMSTIKCGGLPLAITCIASLVACHQETKQKLDIEKMKQQLDCVKKFLYNNLRSGTTSAEILNKVLKLCYSSLPHYLKTCLLYLSMYPENYLILKEDVVKQWIAEGFIVEGKRSTAKIAGSYFDVLVSLGLIQRMDIEGSKEQHRKKKEGGKCDDDKKKKEKEVQVVEVENEEDDALLDSKRVSHVVHPMVYEFITCKSMEDNFITTVDYSQSNIVLTERTHRLSLQFGSATYAATPTSIRLPKVRSLAFMGLLNCMPSLVEFKVVRVMILHIQSNETDRRFSLAEIDKLLLLRYLKVKCNLTVDLPVQMQCLNQLETLEINAGVANVPMDILQHSSLRHVRVGRKIKHKNLAQGPAICTDPIFPTDLSSKPLSAAIQVLELLPPICSFSRLPGWIRKLASLRILKVGVSKLGNYELDHIGKLPLLTVLSLYVDKPDRGVVTFHTEALFPALECFNLIGVSLRFPEKAMPKLRLLKICFNAQRGEKYSNMLHGIQHLPKLKEVVARIGVATDAEESDMIAAESEYAKAISKHPSGLIPNVKRVGKVGDQYDPRDYSNKQGKEVQNEIQVIDSTKQFGISENLTAEDSTNTTPPDNEDLAAIPLQSSSLGHEDLNEEVQEAMNEIQHEVQKQPYIHKNLPQEDLDATLHPLQLSTKARRQSQNEVWTRTELDVDSHRMVMVEHLLQKLLQLMSYYEEYSVSVPENIRCLFDEFRDFIDHYFPDGQFSREWLQSYCDLANDIVDWADSFALSIRVAGGRRSRYWFGRATDWFMTLLARNAIPHELIRDHMARVGELEFRVRELKMLLSKKDIDFVPRPFPFEPQDILAHNHSSRLVGHSRPVKEVTEMVMKSRPRAKFFIISIVGMVGSGKTTLAKAVYQQVREQFECCAFVYMGQHCDIVKSLRDMFQLPEMKDRKGKDVFTSERSESRDRDVEQLKTRLRTFLLNKRYLIMVDDLWSREHWDIIKYCFPENGLDSRIIITTTKDALAMHCSLGNSDCIYKVRLLNDADSEQLFLNEVSDKGQGFHQHFKDNSSEIMKKCGGLPLAIVRAAMLAQRQKVHEWKRIELKSLVSSSDENYMWQRFNLSYSDLPNILKTSMLYLSIFPEYYEVDVDRLMRLWIAEGFININNARYRTLEETALSYLDGLISRNMVLPLHVNHHGIPKCCMVHPVIHDFIVHKSREENFIAIVNDQNQGIANNYHTIRRLSLQSSGKKDPTMLLNNLSDFRSIIVTGPASTVHLLTALRLVRVLDLEGCEVTNVWLDGLGKLLQLRYLSLRGTNVSELPETIGELRCLQTLDVRSTNVKELPLSIASLEKLMHLLCGRAKLPSGISRIAVLQTLSCATNRKNSSSIIRELSEIVDLRELELFLDFTRTPQDWKKFTFYRGGFSSLKKLCIRCNSASVAFEETYMSVEVLELSFEGLLINKSSAVSGIEYLRRLTHVLLEFSQLDAGAMVTVDAVRNDAATRLNNPEVTVNVDGRPFQFENHLTGFHSSKHP